MTPDAADQTGTGSSAPESPLVTAVVLNYRNYTETIDCVTALVTQDYSALNCVVVDNASPNDSFDRLQRAFGGEGRVAVLRAPDNGGYASGNNVGARWAITRYQPRYLLVINPDVAMQGVHALAELVAFANVHDDAGAVSPKVILPNGFHQGPYKRPSLIRTCIQYVFPVVWLVARKRHQRWAMRAARPQRWFRTIGACMLLRADAFAAAGMFDEGTFLEGEEPILAERLASGGKYFYHYPGVTALHNHSRPGESLYTMAGLKYYFGKYRDAGPVSLSALEFCARFYDKFYKPLRRYTPFAP
jgi:GT2 family glycosyltransferase